MLLTAAFFLMPLIKFFFLGHPWYVAAVWGNVFVIVVLVPLGWLWSRAKFWPLRPLENRVEHLHDKVDGLHAKHDAHAEQLEKLAQHLEALHKKLDER
jgi:biopolymer transport protein ExbB/TolQ